jgi:hypothetical protein
MLEGVGAVDFVCLRKEEPEVVEGFPWDKLELGKGVLVGSGLSEVGSKGVDRCLG